MKGSKYPTGFHIQEEMGCLSKNSFHRIVGWKSSCNGLERKWKARKRKQMQNTLSSKATLGKRGCVAWRDGYELLGFHVRGDKCWRERLLELLEKRGPTREQRGQSPPDIKNALVSPARELMVRLWSWCWGKEEAGQLPSKGGMWSLAREGLWRFRENRRGSWRGMWEGPRRALDYRMVGTCLFGFFLDSPQ